jgi:starch synthase
MNNHARPYLREYGLAPSDAPMLPDWARDSLMGLGLAHADVLNAVSPTYAREILTPEYGYGLEGVLQARRSRLFGILNGLDLDAWDPQDDQKLKARFDVEHLSKRAANKRALQLELGLPLRPDVPLLGVVSRLDTQKGFDIAAPALGELLAEDVQLVLLGTGLPKLEAEFKAIGQEFPDRARIALRFDSALARRIYAGADLLLIPSLYEPCGLAQMIAMRYGAVPVVRRTGGLADTVTDYRSPSRSTGFVFRDYNSVALVKTLRRALGVYRYSARWRALQARGMRYAAAHFAWTHSAQHYIALYQKAQAHRQAALEALDEVRPAT